MNPSLFCTLSFLLLALINNLPLAFSQPNAKLVGDSYGDPITPKGRFYILPIPINATGGGVTLGKADNLSCPVIVLQNSSNYVDGHAVKFTIPGEINPNTNISTETPLDIEFEEKPECAKSSKWVLVGNDFHEIYIGISNATQDHPGKQILTGSGNFKIQNGSFGYYLVFCVDITVPQSCANITRRDDKDGTRFVLTRDDPYEVLFFDVNAVDKTFNT